MPSPKLTSISVMVLPTVGNGEKKLRRNPRVDWNSAVVADVVRRDQADLEIDVVVETGELGPEKRANDAERNEQDQYRDRERDSKAADVDEWHCY